MNTKRDLQLGSNSSLLLLEFFPSNATHLFSRDGIENIEVRNNCQSNIAINQIHFGYIFTSYAG